MIKIDRSTGLRRAYARLMIACAACALAACSQGGSATNSSTTGPAGTGNVPLADAPPPASALPLATGPARIARTAPVAAALPPAPSAPLGVAPPGTQYAYLNQAYAFSQSLADSPPDYGYSYQGEQPWVWESPDGYYRIAETLPSGVRYFYYAPGASTPYLVRDPQFSYAYSGGYLAGVYDPDGRALPWDVAARRARDAGAYLAWAAGLYAAARHEQHLAVQEARWNAERMAVYADEARWAQARERDAAWAAYSQAHQNDQAHWADQRYIRAAAAARFAAAVNDENALARAERAAAAARDVAQTHGNGLAAPPAGATAFAVRERHGVGAPPAGPIPSLIAPSGQRPRPLRPFERPGQPAYSEPEPARSLAGQAPTGSASGLQARRAAEAQDEAQTLARRQTPTTVAPSAAARAGWKENRQAEAQRAEAAAAAQRASREAGELQAQREAQAAAGRLAESEAAQAEAHRREAAILQTQAAATAQRAAVQPAQADAHRQAAERGEALAHAPEAQMPRAAQVHAPPPRPRPSAPPGDHPTKPQEPRH